MLRGGWVNDVNAWLNVGLGGLLVDLKLKLDRLVGLENRVYWYQWLLCKYSFRSSRHDWLERLMND